MTEMLIIVATSVLVVFALGVFAFVFERALSKEKNETSESLKEVHRNIRERWGHGLKEISYHIKTSNCDYYNTMFVPIRATDAQINELVKKEAVKVFKLKWKVAE